jgi:FixJ family two-component response regulator
MNTNSQTVFIVDDDSSICRSLARLVRSAGLDALTFASAEEFLAGRPEPLRQPACLVLDLQMPGIGGLELQRELAAGPSPYPVIFISGNGDIPVTVLAMKQGAVTFLSKPFNDEDLLESIAEALEKHRGLLAVASQQHTIRGRIDGLTDREAEVMGWVITGALNKQIAAYLGIAEKTVKVHRGRVMEKMHATSVAQLVRLCEAAGFAAAGK